MRRWVRYEAPIMVCVEIDEAGYDGEVVNVVLGNEHDDIALARDHRGHFLVYDEAMQRVETDVPAELRAITVAEHRDWPTQLDWEEGLDTLRYPFLYEPVDLDDAEDEDDLEPLDIQEHDPAQ
jgi:hypothetical protein